jgi:hypothetical protein
MPLRARTRDPHGRARRVRPLGAAAAWAGRTAALPDHSGGRFGRLAGADTILAAVALAVLALQASYGCDPGPRGVAANKHSDLNEMALPE